MVSGKEYLVWNQSETRYTPIGNHETETRLNLGKYPIIEMSNVMVQEESGLKKVVTEPTGALKTGYSLPYTVENIDKLHENAIDDYEDKEGTEVKPTRYYLYNSRKNSTMAIQKWEDFEMETLTNFMNTAKKVSSEQEAKSIKDKVEKERQQVEELKLDTLKRSVG